MNSRRIINDWLVSWLVDYLDISQKGISSSVAFSELGLDSVGAVTLVGDLESFLQTDLDPTLLWSYPTIVELIGHVESIGALENLSEKQLNHA